MCQFPKGKHPVPLDECHIDHIQSGKLGIIPPNWRELVWEDE
jgi:hypothetical protein